MPPTASLYPHMVHEYYVRRLRDLTEQREAKLLALKTPRQAMAWQREVRRKLSRSFGSLPARTPLCPDVTGRVERDAYAIERVIFQSRPGFFVTANLYLPKRGGTGPFPAVLGTCGHTANGKAAGPYQSFARGLAEQGFVVLIYDPLGQGERGQYEGLPQSLKPKHCVEEHCMAGKQLAMLGEFLGTWRVWDGIRALDYLLSRPEVDRTRVGVTGNSGGGTLSSYLNAFDERFTMAAPSCYVTTYLSNLENELPTDSEQIPPWMLAQGLDMGDFFIARAPRPVLLIGQQQDAFDERGLRKTYEQVRRFYQLLGAPDAAQLYIGPGAHGYFPDARHAMYQFFNRIAQGSQKRTVRESDAPLEKDEHLLAAPGGMVSRIKSNVPIHQLARQSAAQMRRQRKQLSATHLRAAISGVLELPVRARPPHYRVLRALHPSGVKAYPAAWVFALETEPGIQSILYAWQRADPARENAWHSHPPVAAEVTLYLPHLSSEEDVSQRPGLAGQDILFSLDARGFGRCMPRTCDDKDFFSLYGQDYFYAAHGLMLGESYLGRRVHDVLAALDLLKSRGTRRVHLHGRGLGSLLAVFAGALHPLVTRVTLENAPRSYEQMLHEPVFRWPFSIIPWGVLQRFDLPDCYRLLRAKKLRLIEPWNARMCI